MHNFKELKDWNKSLDLAVNVYRLSKKFPTSEKFGLTSQINRSAVSVNANIAEGAGRNTNGEFKQFLGIATGSLYELESPLIISEQVGIILKTEFDNISSQIEEVAKMIFGLKSSLSKNIKS